MLLLVDCPLSLIGIFVSVFTVCNIQLQFIRPLCVCFNQPQALTNLCELNAYLITALLGWRSRLLHYSLVMNLSIGFSALTHIYPVRLKTSFHDLCSVIIIIILDQTSWVVFFFVQHANQLTLRVYFYGDRHLKWALPCSKVCSGLWRRCTNSSGTWCWLITSLL